MSLPPALPLTRLPAGMVATASGHGWLTVPLPTRAESSRGDGTPSREGVSELPLPRGKRVLAARGGAKARGHLLLEDVQAMVPIKMLLTLEKPSLSLSCSFIHCRFRCRSQPGRSHSARAARAGGAARSLPLSQSRGSGARDSRDRGEPAPPPPPVPCAAAARGALGGAGLWAELCCSMRPSTLAPQRLLCGILFVES